MKARKLLSILFCYTLLQTLIASTAFAKDAPIYIEANHMTSTENTNTVFFEGDVDAKQDDVRIRSNKMTVFYSKASKGEKSQQVKKIICTGNTEVTRGEWLGTGQRMVYTTKDKKIVLTGNAKAWQNQNMVSGETITYFLDQKRSEVVGTPQKNKKPSRVNMTIIQN
ncbi:lipopolysaccharide transport periplasmic protein LptA [Desulfotalea psychrophila]|uniref:Organic solvent tolerance-like N-terminal domain-containing protein n=1 Tax=Desulfotalea psychrophila (strain LSv54 / DSM 12343) TaxID=177439 RepID=Q6AR55_DESPS|nr:lipopolysaccharide transport periplasmic protein LptA [Desulfotalea psychrophila]CAG35169.1 unknown protein [Desulfotalea psychrophila LSv54]